MEIGLDGDSGEEEQLLTSEESGAKAAHVICDGGDNRLSRSMTSRIDAHRSPWICISSRSPGALT